MKRKSILPKLNLNEQIIYELLVRRHHLLDFPAIREKEFLFNNANFISEIELSQYQNFNYGCSPKEMTLPFNTPRKRLEYDFMHTKNLSRNNEM